MTLTREYALRIRIKFGGDELIANLAANETARAVFAALPCKGIANRWGDEVYFDLPVSAVEEDMKQMMDPGDIGYWIEGGALAIFFGPTPASSDSRPKAAMPVVHVGIVQGDASSLGSLGDGDAILVEPFD